ncbi:hypothetical protein MUG91_G3359n1 [Manis pentadactyla]|nr:hypothetical protein MUG91_G3359n1 [Manis pentadactyla]
MELCAPTPSRVRLPLLQTADFRFRMSLLEPPQRSSALRSTVSVSLGSPQITLPFRMSLIGPPQRDLLPASRSTVSVSLGSPQITGPPGSLFQLPCLGAVSSLIGPKQIPETPHKKILNLLQLRLGPHAVRDPGAVAAVELLHPDTLTRAGLFCRQPTSVSDEPPSEPHRDLLPASRSTVSVSLGSPQIRFRFRIDSFGPPQRSSARFSFHCLRVLEVASDHDPETPHKKILILLQPSRPPCQRGDREQWPLDGTLHPDTLSVRFTSSADSRLPFRMSLLRAPTGDLLPASRSTVSVSLGSPQITLPFRIDSSGPEIFARFSFHPVSVSWDRLRSRSGDTPQKILILLQHVLGDASEGDRGSGRLMELCTLTPSRVRLPLLQTATSVSDEPPSGPHRDLLPFVPLSPCPRIASDHGDPETPENTDSSATRLSAPMQRGYREQWRLMETLHPDTLTCGPLLQTADFRYRISLLRAPTEICCPLLVPLSPCPAQDRLRSRFRFRMSLLRAPTEIFCPLLVPLSPCPWDRLRSRFRFGQASLGPTGIFCPLLVPYLVSLGSPQITLPFRMSLLRGPPQRSSARFSFHCLRVLGIASDPR